MSANLKCAAWVADKQAKLVFLSSYGSWLHLVGVASLRYVALNGTDHRIRIGQNVAIGAYIRWRNGRARP